MKKSVILVMATLLAACHDGGGHHHNDDVIVKPVTPEIAMPGAVQTWAAGGNTAVAYAGDDNDDILKFTLDTNGAITAVNFDNRNYARQGNQNEYAHKDVKETRTLNLVTLGRDAGMRYADFGYAMETERDITSTERDFYVFAGGDATKELRRSDLNGATYTGTAVAYIESDMQNSVKNQISQTDDAQLVVDANGNRTMSMNFSNADKPWYDVVVTNGKIALSGGDNVAAEFKVDGMVMDSSYESVNAYGDTTAQEVVYRVGAEYENKITGREVEFDAAFGGVRQ